MGVGGADGTGRGKKTSLLTKGSYEGDTLEKKKKKGGDGEKNVAVKLWKTQGRARKRYREKKVNRRPQKG